MKKILFIITILFAGVLSFTSCEDDVDLTVLTEEEYPRILGRWAESTDPEKLGTFDAATGRDFSIILQFTPSHLCEGTWYLDGVEYATGPVFEYYSSLPVSHHIKLVVKTPKYTTTREAWLVVKD